MDRGRWIPWLMCALLCLGSSVHADDGEVVIGVTEAVHDRLLSFSQDGIVAHLFVEEGSWVEKGTPLMQLQSARQTLEKKRRQRVLADRSQLNSAQARLDILKPILKSTRRLFERSGSVSAEEVKRIELQVQELKGRIEELSARQDLEKLELEIVEQQLAERTLVAPVAGIVNRIFVDVGERVGSQKGALQIVDPRHCILLVNVDERDVRRIRGIDELPIEIRAGQQWIERIGSLDYISPIADPSSGLVRIRIGFNNSDSEIWPGVPGRLQLP